MTSTSASGPSGAFVKHALAYFERNLFVTPTGGKDGKKPLLTDYGKKRLGPDAIIKLGKKFPDANLAVVTGLSRLAVVDVDEPSDAALDRAIDRFGSTPLISRTGGKGGVQLFYKGHPSLRPIDFRHVEGWEGELRVDGNIVIAPPSIHRETGRGYEFIAGDIDDVTSLPQINLTAFDGYGFASVDTTGKRIPETKRVEVEVGTRNNWLFRQCLTHAAACDDLDALIDIARTRAEENFSVQMLDSEIIKTARSAWGYQERGENWVGMKSRLPITLADLDELEPLGSDAVVLAFHLRLEHGGRMARGETFALATVAMEASGTIPGWSRWKYREAIEKLMKANVLKMVHQGTRKGDPSQFRIRMKAA